MKRGGKCSGGLCPNSTHHIEVATTISSFDKKKTQKNIVKSEWKSFNNSQNNELQKSVVFSQNGGKSHLGNELFSEKIIERNEK